MNKARINAFRKKLHQILLSLKQLSSEALSSKPGMARLIAVLASALIFVLVLIIVLAASGRKEAAAKVVETTPSAQIEYTEPTAAPDPVAVQPVGVPATMGTVTADGLSICKDAGVDIDVDAYYAAGDRVEIHETKDVTGTPWGYTGEGWVRMDCIRMDDVPPFRNDSTNFDGTDIVSNGSYTVLGYGVVDLKALNVRVGPGTDYSKIKEIPQGVRYAYYEVSDDWVRISDGWVSTAYFYIEGTTAEDATTGTVTTNDLNVRTGPATSFQRVSSYMEEDSVEILAEVNGWGYTEKGWISMMYVALPDPVYTTGSATVTIGLNIREEPNPDSEKVDAYKKGDRVIITEVKDGWGKTDKGWINLDYVKYD